ncbi:hypothetical protein [Spirilliplanes yamanashiensis]|uniref:VWFA domain-containing protein n=1 Tax=Spirilliplanes yamanashiensis TaxID=42233 RepID=A0A8J3Y7N0_9ACTN|nr:hypothetical protein [Spirilliplanes yamanashiensis]MDP9817329.1 hypothetical protein [Spirilliplanes yamanashiensis]GIJ03020.1 hypothetical protein Sya03_23720 [Spirilliplanes yamanashiensis]
MPDRRVAAAAAAVLAAALAAGPAAASPAPPSPALAADLPVVAVLPGDRETALVADLGAGPATTGGAGAATGAGTVTVTVGGVPRPATLRPVLSDDLAVALVVDASADGAAALPTWLSAAARFALEAPAAARTVVVADTTPPSLRPAPQPGAAGVVRALSTVEPGGERRTAEALTLAVRQFRPGPPGRRLIVLYTSGADAGPESAAALGRRLAREGVILVVAGAAAHSGYWSAAVRATGGFFAPAAAGAAPAAGPALDQVAATLRGRCLVTFATPADRPAPVAVRIDGGGAALAGTAIVPAGDPPARERPSAWWWAGAGVAAAAAALLGLRLAARRPEELPPRR